MKKVFFVLSLLVLFAGCKDEEVQLTDREQLDKDMAIIDKWLIDNSITALRDPSGLSYVITTPGIGAKPALTNTVVVKYVGKFLTEEVKLAKSVEFDNSTSITYKLSGFIAGWQIGFQLLPKGSKATLYIPSGLAYGKNGYGSAIPPNSNLFFDVELIDVK